MLLGLSHWVLEGWSKNANYHESTYDQLHHEVSVLDLFHSEDGHLMEASHKASLGMRAYCRNGSDNDGTR